MSIFGIRNINKRSSAFCTKRTVFVALFLVGLFGVYGAISLLLNVNAAETPVRSVEIVSDHSNYENSEPGGWKITKSAEWIDAGKARITFDVNSIPKYDDSKKLDIIMVIDNSGSMAGEKMAQVKTDASDLASSVLSDSNNKMSLIVFNTEATVLSAFTNEKNQILSQIDNISIAGCTNYYDGLLKAEEVLDGYIQDEGRELILLFLTDGFPNEQVPGEKAEYEALKAAYPYMTINGIQYEMGTEILQPIIDISDNQFVADMSSLNNILFEATIVPYVYEDFTITDYINDAYWTITGIEAISASLGEIGLEYDGSTPKISWDMSGLYHSGRTATLTIEINLKSEYLNLEDLVLSTNIHEEIQTKIDDTPDEDIDSPKTPILKDVYSVIYHANSPAGCELSGTVPETTNYSVFTGVLLSDNKLSCQNYNFKGWRVANDHIEMINEDSFRMPGENVHIYAVWSKPNITKTMDGTVHTRGTATLDDGQTINIKMKILAGQSNATFSTYDYSITAFVRADTLPQSIDTNNANNIFSSSDSQLPIYGWYNEGIIYYFTDAEDIYTNKNPSGLFYRLTLITDISSVSDWITTNATNMSSLLSDAQSITNVDALRNWDTSNVTNIRGAFWQTYSLTNVDGVANWDTSKVTTMDVLFYGAGELVDISGLANWDVSKATNFWQIFRGTKKLTDISPLRNWDTSSVTNMSYAFGEMWNLESVDDLENWNFANVTNASNLFATWGDSNKIENVDALRKWNMSTVRDMSGMFNGNSMLSNIDGLSEWDTSSVTTMSSTFQRTGITNIDALSRWSTVNVTTMSSMFEGANKLLNIDGALNWNTSKVTSMSRMFYGAILLDNIDGALNWDTTKVTTMASMFDNAQHLRNIDGAINWRLPLVTNMSRMFYFAPELQNVNGALHWGTNSVTSMNEMFSGNKKLTNIDGLANWDVSRVADFSNVFYRTGFTDIDALINWNIESATNMDLMFYSSKLTNVNGAINWNTTNVTSMKSIFSQNTDLEDISGLANWVTSSVTSMESVFAGDNKIGDINSLARWKTLNVKNMNSMFSGLSQITSLEPLRTWDVSQLENAAWMFSNVSGVTSVEPLSAWTTTSLINMERMFNNTHGVTDYSPLNGWDVSNVTNMSGAFYQGVNTIYPNWYTP